MEENQEMVENQKEMMENLEKSESLLIFRDIFRRANKKDDGAVSWEEFVSYFDDGVTDVDDLRTLFNDIDTHNTNNIDTGEMCSYFYKHLGSFEGVFEKLEEMNTLVSASLTHMAKEYGDKTWQEKFVSRFLMREISTQLSALGQPIAAATDALDDHTRISQISSKKETPPTIRPAFNRSISGVVPGRYARRAKQQGSVTHLPSMSESAPLSAQIDKLTDLLNKMETKMTANSIVDMTSFNMVSLAHTEYPLTKDTDVTQLKQALCDYVSHANSSQECLKVDVRITEESVSVYKVWSSENIIIVRLHDVLTHGFVHGFTCV